MRCQLTNIPELRLKNSRFNNLFQFRIKLVWAAKKKLLLIKNKLFNSVIAKSKQVDFGKAVQTKIVSGDIVKVLSKEEIYNILNDRGATRGCVFTPEMYERCGKTHKVLKRVDWFYDEAKEKMCKCKDIVLLEGAVCSGRRKIFSEDCDRNCFQFWHVSWLKKVE